MLHCLVLKAESWGLSPTVKHRRTPQPHPRSILNMSWKGNLGACARGDLCVSPVVDDQEARTSIPLQTARLLL